MLNCMIHGIHNINANTSDPMLPQGSGSRGSIALTDTRYYVYYWLQLANYYY